MVLIFQDENLIYMKSLKLNEKTIVKEERWSFWKRRSLYLP